LKTRYYIDRSRVEQVKNSLILIMSFYTSLEQSLYKQSQKSLLRRRKARASPVAAEILIDGKNYINFAANDYLGLANDSRVIAAFKKAANYYGVGSGAAYMVSGYTVLHQALEEELADFLGYPRVLVFSTGYMANVGTLTALSPYLDVILEDKLNHASLIDGGRFAGVQFERYLHRSMTSLSAQLARYQNKRCLVVSDGVFSVTGDVALLPELSQKTHSAGQLLMIDDAHGIGVLGQKRSGSLDHFHLDSTAVDILVGTFGKAFGTFGAFVAGNDIMIEALLQYARSYTYTTGLPPAIAAATRVSLDIIKKESWRQDKLNTLIDYFRQSMTYLSIPFLPSFTPIQCIPVGDAQIAAALGDKLMQRGVMVGVMRPPTTPPRKSCLRVTLTALHEKSHVDALCLALKVLHQFNLNYA
jgi:8-amino-7-oxononanoate synthase